MQGVNFFLKDLNKEAGFIFEKGVLRGSSSQSRFIILYVRCLDGQFKKSTKIKVRECDWIESDSKRGIFQRVDPKIRGAKEINERLDELSIAVNKVLRKGEVYKSDLLDLFGNRGIKSDNVLEFIDSFIEVQTRSAKCNYERLRHHFGSYPGVITWRGFDDFFYKKYVDFLTTKYIDPKGKLGVLNSTVGKDITSLKKICRAAIKSGFEVNKDVFEYKKPLSQTKRIFVTEEDLEGKLIALDINSLTNDQLLSATSHEGKTLKNNLDKSIKEKLEIDRDCYVFLFDTGMRFSDASKIKDENIIFDTNDEGDFIQVISFSQTKTKSANYIPLSDRAVSIINKYKGKQKNALPFTSDDAFNKRLKRLFKLAGFTGKVSIERWKGDKEIVEVFEEWQILTSHTGRHSAATDLLTKTGDITTVRDFLGHASVKTTEIYAKNIRKKFNSKILDAKNKKAI